MYFMTIFKDVKYFEDAGNVRGFRCTAVCDTVGAWEEKTIKKTVGSSSTFTIQVLQDGIYEVMPVFTIDLSGTSVTVNVNGDEMSFTNMTSGTRITVDCEKLIAISSEGEELYATGRFNKVFPTLVYGTNTVSVTGSCNFKMTYRMIREVGC
jgi:phage-related protein